MTDGRSLVVFTILLALVGWASVASAFDVKDYIPVPAYNVTVKFVDYGGVTRGVYIPVVPESYKIIQLKELISLTYDNTTWIKVDRIERDKWKITSEGVTENAFICMQANATDRYKKFLSNPDHCYTKVTALVDGKEAASTYADVNGKWEIRFRLSPGNHSVEFVARDPAGNKAVEARSVSWFPSSGEQFLYYMSMPYVEVGIGVGIVVVILIILKVTLGRVKYAKMKKEKRKKESIKLSQLFAEESYLINTYEDRFMEMRDYRLKIREIISQSPFAERLTNDVAKFVSLFKEDPQKALDFIRRNTVKKRWFDLIKLDKNLKLGSTVARAIASVYVDNIRDLIIEHASSELGMSRHEIIVKMKEAGDI